MMNLLSLSFGEESSVASDPHTKLFGPGATAVRAATDYKDYGFIAVLGLAQRLGIHFLPITWQAPLGSIGEGGQARINQALVDIQTSFAFKQFKYPDYDPFREIVQEMVILCHPIIRKHKHIVSLEGICWDVRQDENVWPVLVFQKSHFEDLFKFARSEEFRDLSIEDKLRLCADVGSAIRDMHSNGIIHGDIKPHNVLIFKENSQIIAKVADFGFSTCFQGDDSWISMPKSEPWNAPEHEGQHFRPFQAKQMDVYSFAMLCAWLLFEAGSSGYLSLPPNTVLENGRFASFERNQPANNLIQIWRRGTKLVDWINWLVFEDNCLNSRMKNCLISFFRSTIAVEPGSRCTDLQKLVCLLSPHRNLQQTELAQVAPAPEQEDFQIPPSIWEFYNADFRLRNFIFKQLSSLVIVPIQTIIQHSLPVKIATQLALSYMIGFGTNQNNEQATILLNEYSLSYTDCQSRLEWIKSDDRPPHQEDTLYVTSTKKGNIETMDFAQHYREKRLLERAETVYAQEVQDLASIFGRSHTLYWTSMMKLASIMESQGRWEEAESLFVQVLEIVTKVLGAEHMLTLRIASNLAVIYTHQERWDEAERTQMLVMELSPEVLGEEHPSTLNHKATLAGTYKGQGRWKEAEELEIQLMESFTRLFGKEHARTLASMGNLASTYRDQGCWEKAEQLETQVWKTTERVLGIEHPDTLISMHNLASLYTDQGRWKEAEELIEKTLKISLRAFGKEHLVTLRSLDNLASVYSHQGHWKRAEELQIQVMEIRNELLYDLHPDVLTSIHNLASTYIDQGRWKEAEQLQKRHLETHKTLFGEEHPNTLKSMSNLGLIYSEQELWKEAELLQMQVLEMRKRLLGEVHIDTLTSMTNLAAMWVSQGRWEEAEKLQLQVIKISSLDEEHPFTLTSLANLASTYRDQKRWKEAEELTIQVMNMKKRVLGVEHPSTLTSMNNLALIYSDQKSWQEAGRLQRQVVEMSSRLFGEEHPLTLTSKANLAYTLSM